MKDEISILKAWQGGSRCRAVSMIVEQTTGAADLGAALVTQHSCFDGPAERLATTTQATEDRPSVQRDWRDPYQPIETAHYRVTSDFVQALLDDQCHF
jgi:hypothetical protein